MTLMEELRSTEEFGSKSTRISRLGEEKREKSSAGCVGERYSFAFFISPRKFTVYPPLFGALRLFLLGEIKLKFS